MYELGRVPRSPTRRSYHGRHIGQLDIAAEVGGGLVSDVTSLITGGKKAAERTSDIDSYYQMALSGNPQGIALLKAWITDQPPHPNPSIAYAQQKLAALGQQVISPTGAAIATGGRVVTGPGGVIISSSGGVGGAIPTGTLLLIGGAVIAFLLVKKR